MKPDFTVGQSVPGRNSGIHSNRVGEWTRTKYRSKKSFVSGNSNKEYDSLGNGDRFVGAAGAGRESE